MNRRSGTLFLRFHLDSQYLRLNYKLDYSFSISDISYFASRCLEHSEFKDIYVRALSFSFMFQNHVVVLQHWPWNLKTFILSMPLAELIFRKNKFYQKKYKPLIIIYSIKLTFQKYLNF